MFVEDSDIIIPDHIGHYTMGETIGNGAFAVVKMIYDNETRNIFACKIVPRERLEEEELEERFETEIRVLQQMKHRNITQLYDLYKDENNYYIVMEYCPYGELFQTIVEKKFLPIHEAKIYLAQIVSALKYIHSMNAVHRDLKPENLLLGVNKEIKLTDFGFSRYVGNSGLVETACGSPCYASPECLSGNPYNGTKSDIWSTGVIFYAMVTGQLPWTKRNQTQLFEQIKKGQYKIPNRLDEDTQNMIRAMMCVDPDKRISAEEILAHPWMQDAIFKFRERPDVPGVTLKQVDKFFDRDLSSSVFRNLDIDSTNSGRASNFNTIGRILNKKVIPHEEPQVKVPKTLSGAKLGNRGRLSSVSIKPKLTLPTTKKSSKKF